MARLVVAWAVELVSIRRHVCAGQARRPRRRVLGGSVGAFYGKAQTDRQAGRSRRGERESRESVQMRHARLQGSAPGMACTCGRTQQQHERERAKSSSSSSTTHGSLTMMYEDEIPQRATARRSPVLSLFDSGTTGDHHHRLDSLRASSA